MILQSVIPFFCSYVYFVYFVQEFSPVWVFWRILHHCHDVVFIDFYYVHGVGVRVFSSSSCYLFFCIITSCYFFSVLSLDTSSSAYLIDFEICCSSCSSANQHFTVTSTSNVTSFGTYYIGQQSFHSLRGYLFNCRNWGLLVKHVTIDKPNKPLGTVSPQLHLFIQPRILIDAPSVVRCYWWRCWDKIGRRCQLFILDRIPHSYCCIWVYS